MELLSDLMEKDKFAISTLHYPDDLGEGRLGHYINFYIHTPQQSQYKRRSYNSSISGINGVFQGSTVFGDGATQSIATQNKIKDFSGLGSNGLFGTATNAVTGVNGADIVDNILKSVSDFIVTGGKTQLSDVVSLYMPDTITVAQQAEYSRQSLTDALGALGLYGSAASEINSAVDTIENKGIGGIGDVFKSVGDQPLALERVGVLTDKILGNKNKSITDILLNRIGYAVNPQMQVIFKTVDFRTFQFDFLFTPKTPEEATQVKNIIKTFRLHQLPEVADRAMGRYYTVPSQFDIEYMLRGKNNTNLHKLSTCVLTALYVDYAPVGWVTYEDGMPVQTRLTLSFMEQELMTKNKIEQGY